MALTLTERWMQALRKRGVRVHDDRGTLPTHKSKRYTKRDTAKLEGVCWHHSAGTDVSASAFGSMARYHAGLIPGVVPHLAKTGAPGIAYTFGVVSGGAVHVFWDLDVMTWSQKGGNTTHIGGVVLGNFRSDGNHHGHEPTHAQRWVVRKVSRVTRRILQSDSAMWAAVHSDFVDTECPGDNLRRLVVQKMRGELPTFSRVVDRQRALRQLLGIPLHGERLEVDGLWGPESRAALEEYQRRNGLTVDGLWGPKTEASVVAALNAVLS